MRAHPLLALSLLALGCSPHQPPPAPAWHVAAAEGRSAIRDPEGRTVILHGANLAGAHKSPPYFGFHLPADYQRLRDSWGMNAIRFLVVWAAIEPQKGVYDSAYLDSVAMRIKWAEDAGLLVVIDMHQDLYGEGFNGDGAPRWTCDEARYAAFKPRDPWFLSYLDPNMGACYDAFWTSDELQSHYVEAWRRLAERLKDSPAILGFDPMNEPYWGTYPISAFELDRLEPFYVKVVHAVRGEAKGWLAFLEPSSSRNQGFSTGLEPFPFSDVVYSPHSYDSVAEGGGGFDPATRRGPYVGNIVKLAGEAQALGAALWIGEFGGMTGTPGIVPYMSAQYDGDGMTAASSMYWAYDRNDGGYGMVKADGSEKPDLDGVLARPYPARIAGDLVSYAFDPATLTFTVKLHPDLSIKAPTELAIADRNYPKGYVVECGNCTVTKQPGGALLGGVNVDTIIVHP